VDKVMLDTVMSLMVMQTANGDLTAVPAGRVMQVVTRTVVEAVTPKVMPAVAPSSLQWVAMQAMGQGMGRGA